MGKVSQKVKEKVEKVKSTIKKGITKVKQFRESPEGQRIEKAAKASGLKFLKESGLGKKTVDFINDEAKPYTRDSLPMDIIRQNLHNYYSNYFQDQQPLGEPSYKIGSAPTVMVNRKRPRYK